MLQRLPVQAARQRKMAGFTSHPDSTMLPFALSWVLVKTHPETSAREDCPVSSFDYDSLIAKIPNYPEPGVLFRDITPLIGNAQGFQRVVDDIADHFAGRGVTKVVGAEARGFMVGAPVAYKLGAGFVPARKPGKLPREAWCQEYELEYGKNFLEIHKDAIAPEDKVLIVDDLIATGGTAVAMVKLIEQAGAELVGLGFLLELAGFKPREVVAQATGADFYSLVRVDAK